LLYSIGIKGLVIDITPQIDSYFQNFKEVDKLRRGNKIARERMSILYDLAYNYKALVLGTSNKTELLLGYGTIFGDLASSINPLGDLYKSQVFKLAEYLKVPEKILLKKPSADLWEEQTDEEELGFTYSTLDPLLYYMVDCRFSLSKLIHLGFNKEMITSIVSRIKKNQFKRKQPIILKVSNRTVNIDFRYFRDWFL